MKLSYLQLTILLAIIAGVLWIALGHYVETPVGA